MTNPQELKKTIGEATTQLENHLEPYQRGLLFIALTTLLLISIYYLTKKEKSLPRELTDLEKKDIENLTEARILKRMEFFRKLRE